MGDRENYGAEAHALRIRQAISDARKDGVNVNLDWDEDEDGIHVKLTTSAHRRLPSDDGEVQIMRIVDGPWLVEGY